MANLAQKIEQLPPELRREAEDFVAFLLERRTIGSSPRPGEYLGLSWAGALKDLGERGITAETLKQEIRKAWIEAALD